MISNSDVEKVLIHFHKNLKPTALVCHAPAVLVSTKNNGFLYKGYKVTAFTDKEELQTPVGPKMLTTPQKLLTSAGVNFIEKPSWTVNFIQDRE